MDYLPIHAHKTYIISYYLSISNNILSDTYMYHTFHDILIALLLSLIRRRTDVHHVIYFLNHSHILYVMRRNTRQIAYRHVACQTRFDPLPLFLRKESKRVFKTLPHLKAFHVFPRDSIRKTFTVMHYPVFEHYDTLSFAFLVCIILYIDGKQFRCGVFTFIQYF